MRNFTAHTLAVRTLIDEATAVNFTDTEILTLSNDTIDDLSSLQLKTKQGTITRVAGQTSYDHPSGSLKVIDSITVGSILWSKFTDWETYCDSTNEYRYYYTDDKIYFNRDPGADATINYRASHTQFTSSGASTSDVPVYLDPVVVDGTLVRIYEKMMFLLGKNKAKYPDMSEDGVRQIIKYFQAKYEAGKEQYKTRQGIGHKLNTRGSRLTGPVSSGAVYEESSYGRPPL